MPNNIISSNQSIWSLLGLAGTSKSYIGKHVTEQNNWLHLELDQGTNIDGIDLFKFRYEWELFFNKGITELLVDKLTEIYSSQNFNGAVVTFASRYVLSREHIEAVKSHIKTVYLFGSK